MKLARVRELTEDEVDLICDALEHFEDCQTLDEVGTILAKELRGKTVEVSE